MASWPAKNFTRRSWWQVTYTFILEQTAKSSNVNLRFCLFVKIQSRSRIENNTRISQYFISNILTGQHVWLLWLLIWCSLDKQILSHLRKVEVFNDKIPVSINNWPITREMRNSVASNLRAIGIMHRGPRLELLCLCQPASSPVEVTEFSAFSPYLSSCSVWRRIPSIIVMGIVLADAVSFHNFVPLDGIINMQCEYYTVISVLSIRRDCPFAVSSF